MSNVTAGYDAVLQIAGSALASAGRAMHQAGSVSHGAVRIHNGTRFEFSFGAPRMELDATSHPDAFARCIARTRVVCRTQRADDPYGAVKSAVADLALRGKLKLPPGDPAPIDGDSEIVIDWSDTTASDIVVHAASSAVQSAVNAALLDMVSTNAPALFTIGHLRTAGVTSMALGVVPAAAGQTQALSIGLNFTGQAGARAAMTNLLQRDWVAAIDADLIAGQVLAALRQAIGGHLPPPWGPSAVLVDESVVCGLRTPFGCVGTTQRTYLDALIIAVTTGGIKFLGEMRQESDSIFLPPVSASWDATVAIAVTPQGTLRTTVGVPTVHLNQWYAVAMNVLTANRLEQAVKDGVQGALDAGLGADAPAGMLGVLVTQLATAGRTADARLAPRPTSVESGPAALLVHGVIDHGLSAPVPVAALTVIATPTAGQLLFDAGGSWTPGDDAITYDWEFGDGAVASSSAANATFAADHKYAPGSYTACVRITDSQGRRTRKCLSVQPRKLALEHIPDGVVSKSAWQACVSAGTDLKLAFEVTSCGTRLPGVNVMATGDRWTTHGTTDARGRVVLDLKPIHATPPSASPHSAFAKGSFAVEASLAGFDIAQGAIELIDCDELSRIILATKEAFAARMDRLAGYAALRDLLKSGIGKNALPQLGLPHDVPKPHLQPRISGAELDALGIGIGARVLADLIQLLELNRDVFPVHQLLGLDPHAQNFPKVLRSRLDSLWRSLDSAANRLEDGPGHRPPPKIDEPHAMLPLNSRSDRNSHEGS